MTVVRRLGILLASVASLCVACGQEPEHPIRENTALLTAVADFEGSGLDRKPFAEFTDGGWDRLHLFRTEDRTREEVDALVGAEVAPSRAVGGLSVYFDDGEVVRVESVRANVRDGKCTTAAHVRKGYACRLHDDNSEHFPV